MDTQIKNCKTIYTIDITLLYHTQLLVVLCYIYIYIYIYKVNQSHCRPEVTRGVQEVKVPRLRDNGPGWWQGCQP